MLDLLRAHQHIAALQQFYDGGIGVEDALAFVFSKPIAKPSGLIDVAALVEVVLGAGVKVVCAM